MKVLNFGSLNIDFVYTLDHFVQKGETISSDALDLFSGGKGLNQSVALGKAGAQVWHAGAIGPDGDFLLEVLKQAQVKTELIRVLPEQRTGNAIIQRDRSGDNCIILYGGANQCISREQAEETIRLFDAGDYLVLQNEINEMAYIMELAHEKGMKIVLNPSPMNEKILQMPLQYVDYFILNEIEAEQLLGNRQENETYEELAIRLAAKFSGEVILTLGENGSVYTDGKQLHRQQAYRNHVVDTTAAGDTFTGYLIAGLTRGEKIAESMDFASRASAIAVSKPGAAPSVPERAEVLAWKGI